MASPLQTVAAAGYEPSMIRVLKGREDSVRPFRAHELNLAVPDVLRLATIFLRLRGRRDFSNSFLEFSSAVIADFEAIIIADDVNDFAHFVQAGA